MVPRIIKEPTIIATIPPTIKMKKRPILLKLVNKYDMSNV